jgi:hypothetical protein
MKRSEMEALGFSKSPRRGGLGMACLFFGSFLFLQALGRKANASVR